MPHKNWIKAFDGFAVLIDRHTVHGIVGEFSVVLLAFVEGGWIDITRYDTAHGIPQRDILGRKLGLRFKRWMDDVTLN